MELQQLQQEIQSNKLSGAYIFSGPEAAVQRIYVQMIAKKSCLAIARYDTVSEAVKAMSARNLTQEKKLFVVFDDMAFTKAEKAWPLVFDRASKTQNTLILQYSKLDGRLKFSKQNKERLCVFDVLSPEIAVKYVKKELPDLHTDVAEMIAEACEYDYGRILSEISKVKAFSRVSKTDDIDTSALELLRDGIIHQPVGDITFKLTDAIMYADPCETQKYLAQAVTKGEPALVILTVLYNSFRGVLMVQGLGKDKSNAAQRTGMAPWQVKMAMEKMGVYSIAALQKNLRTIQEIEFGIKTGIVDATMALEYAAIACLATV